MVPRQRILELLNGLRGAFPAELDDAQDILDQRGEIINDAEARANSTISSAGEEAHRIADEAEVRADHTVEDADTHAADTVAIAEDDARCLREGAQHEYDNIVGRVSAESDRLIHAGNESYERSVAEGRGEQARLVAESTIVREANDEANRLLSGAHADPSRLREECDHCVDSRFAGFEQTLQETLRSAGRDRPVLRSGASTVGGGTGAQNAPSSFSDSQEHH